MFTRRHFERMAFALAKTVNSANRSTGYTMTKENVDTMIRAFANELDGTNSAFDKERFILAVRSHVEE